jgi:replication factor C subunit 1
MSKNDLLWLEKYRPKTIKDYIGNTEIRDTVVDWIQKFKRKDPDVPRFLVLHGVPGVGKTTLSHIIFNDYNYDIVELNASEQRTKKMIHAKVGVIGKYSVIALQDMTERKQVGLIMDEVDGIAGGDKGGVQELVDIIIGKKIKAKKGKGKTSKTSKKDNQIDSKNITNNIKKPRFKYPVICTCNSIKDKKLQPLLKEALVINVTKPTKDDFKKLAKKIMKQEKFKIDQIVLDKIISSIKLEYRDFINSLYQYYLSKDTHFLDVKKEECGFSNETSSSPISKINYFLKNPKSIKYMNQIVESDSNVFLLNLYGNCIDILDTKGYFKKNKTEIEKKVIANLSNNFVYSDNLHNIIFNSQEWKLMDYLCIVGIVNNIILLRDFNNNLNNKKVFYLTHHNKFNRMCQDEAIIRNKKGILSSQFNGINDSKSLYYIKNIIDPDGKKYKDLKGFVEKFTK